MAVAAAFLSWALLLPVVPLGVLTNGGSDVLAGATTAIFMGCSVLTQWNTPRALRRFGYTPVMVFAAIMLGVPALGHITLDDAPFVLALSAFRGIGFGALTVAESALVAELVPKRFLGRASGLLGLAIGLAQLVGLPLGVWLATEYSFTSVYVLGAVVGLLAAVACIFIPWIVAEGGGSGSGDSIPWRAVVVPCVGITTVAMGFGAVSSFLPAASSSGMVRRADSCRGGWCANDRALPGGRDRRPHGWTRTASHPVAGLRRCRACSCVVGTAARMASLGATGGRTGLWQRIRGHSKRNPTAPIWLTLAYQALRRQRDLEHGL